MLKNFSYCMLCTYAFVLQAALDLFFELKAETNFKGLRHFEDLLLLYFTQKFTL